MIDGMPYLIDYNTEEGILVVDRIRDDLQGLDELRRMNYYTGMSSINCATADRASTSYGAANGRTTGRRSSRFI
jgi:hypothetical protein